MIASRKPATIAGLETLNSRAGLALAILLSGALGTAACSFDTSVTVPNGGDGVSGAADASPGGPDLGGTPDASVVPAADAQSSTGDLEPSGDTTSSDRIGGGGGDPFGPLSCASGQMLVGLGGALRDSNNNTGICFLSLRCSPMGFSQSGQLERIGGVSSVPTFGGAGFCGGFAAPLPSIECADNQVVVGMSARTSGNFGAITQLQLRCATINASTQVQPENFTESWGTIANGNTNDVSTECPAQTVATGIRGRSGAVVDSLAFDCRAISIAP